MWQNIIVMAVLLLAVFFVGRRYLRMLKADNQKNACGCDCNCDQPDDKKPGSCC